MKRRKISDSSSTATHNCAICGERVDLNATSFPFCSERCRKADLGRWFGESYRISRPLRDDDELQDEDFDRGDAN